MSLPTAGELATLCRESDARAVAGFVAALSAACGAAVRERTGSSFVVERGGERTRVAVPVEGAVPAAADAAVTAGRPVDDAADARRVDAATLRNRLLYAIDRDEADALLQRWFDRPLDSFDGETAPEDERPDAGADREDGTGSSAGTAPDAGAGPDAGADPGAPTGGDTETGVAAESRGDRWPNRRAVAVAGAAVLVAVAVVGAGWAGVTGLGGPWSADGPGDGAAGAPSLSPASGGNGASIPVAGGSGSSDNGSGSPADGEAGPTHWRGIPNSSSPFPPGVNATGITDYRRLVEAHRSRLEGRSYRVTFVYRELVDGGVAGVATQTVLVENATTYRVSRTEAGSFETAVPTLVERDAYANGSVRFERASGATPGVPAASRYLDRLSLYLGWYLSVRESQVTVVERPDATAAVRLITADDSWPGVTDARGHATVTGSGLVRTLYRTHRPVEDSTDRVHGTRVVVTIRVSDVGTATVTPPDWVADAAD